MSGSPMHEQAAQLLQAYDAQLRERSEMTGTTSYDRDGPLWRGRFDSHGHVTYRSLDGYLGEDLDDLIMRTLEHFASDPHITTVEWKSRGHDAPADLPQRLVHHGFHPQEQETVMVGEARHLAQDVRLPDGVTVRRIDDVPDPYPELVRAADAQEKAFGVAFGVEDLVQRVQRHRGRVEIWVAEFEREVLCVGRLEFVPDSDFAGLWGGGTLPEWRGKGIHRALTAARARSALMRGVRYLHSDCTAFSRPILERSGLLPITTTTPYLWTRESQGA